MFKPFYVSIEKNNRPTVNEGKYLVLDYDQKNSRFWIVDDAKKFVFMPENLCAFEGFYEYATNSQLVSEHVVPESILASETVKYPINKRGK